MRDLMFIPLSTVLGLRFAKEKVGKNIQMCAFWEFTAHLDQPKKYASHTLKHGDNVISCVTQWKNIKGILDLDTLKVNTSGLTRTHTHTNGFIDKPGSQ